MNSSALRPDKRRGIPAWAVLIAAMLLSACADTPATPTAGTSLQAMPTAATTSILVEPVPVTSDEMLPPAGDVLLAAGDVGLDELLSPNPGSPPDATAAPPVVQGVTTLQKIEAAEIEGRIDSDRALIYKIMSAYDPDRLPAELQGESGPGDWHHGRTLLRDMLSNYEQLPADLKREADAFISRPTEAASIWNRNAALSNGEFQFVDSGEEVKLWYIEGDTEDDESKSIAENLAEELTQLDMWNIERSIMQGHEPCSDGHTRENGGDGRLDIYLLPRGSLYPRDSLSPNEAFEASGLTIPQAEGEDGCPYTSFILVNEDMIYDDIRVTLPHELLHSFQFSFDQDVSEDYNWWDEATATWVEDEFYPALNAEWYMLTPGKWANYNGPNGPLDRFEWGGYAQYGAYIFPYFMTNREDGIPRTLIGDMYGGTTRKAPLEIMSSRGGWDDLFKQFALWNWNRWPAQFYSDEGERIRPLAQKTAPIQVLLNEGPSSVEVRLAHTSIRYYSLEVDGGLEDAGQIVVDVSSLTQQTGAGVQAIIVTGSEDEPEGHLEDWSDVTRRSLCLREQKPLRQLILVVSNSQITAQDELRGDIAVQARRQWCPISVPTPGPTRSPIILPGG